MVTPQRDPSSLRQVSLRLCEDSGSGGNDGMGSGDSEMAAPMSDGTNSIGASLGDGTLCKESGMGGEVTGGESLGGVGKRRRDASECQAPRRPPSFQFWISHVSVPPGRLHDHIAHDSCRNLPHGVPSQ